MDPSVDILQPQTDFDLDISFNNSIEASTFSNWNDTTLQYPGTGDNTIAIRATMENAIYRFDSSRYRNVVHNLDSIQILMKKTGSNNNYEPIQGSHYRSEFLLGAARTTPVYPATLNLNYGLTTRTGGSPRAYQDGVIFRPYDNYYYADFTTRIYKANPNPSAPPNGGIAHCPQNARYNDGDYLIKARAVNVLAAVFEGPKIGGVLTPIEFTLDNYKPFVESITVKFGNVVVYRETWTDNNNQTIEWTNNNLSTTITTTELTAQASTVSVKSSEELEYLRLSIPSLNITNRPPDPNPNGDNIYFKFDLGTINPADLGEDVKIYFTGRDKNNNALIAFDGSYSGAQVDVPTRTGTTTWQDDNTPNLSYGDDSMHQFYIGCASNFTGHSTSENRSPQTFVYNRWIGSGNWFECTKCNLFPFVMNKIVIIVMMDI